MWHVIPQPGFASVVVDFANDLSPLIVGLIGLVALSAGMIVIIAVRHYLSQETKLVTPTVSDIINDRDAA